MGYMGAVIGAGFASGQEIVQFFVAYLDNGFKGALMAMLLFALLGAVLMFMAHQLSISNYQDLLKQLFGEKWGPIIDLLLAVFLFLGVSTMMSASGAIFYEHLYLNKYLGISLAFLSIFLLLSKGKHGLIYSYNVLVPLKIILLLLISGYAAFCMGSPAATPYTAPLRPVQAQYWGVAALLYVAYNFTLAMVVLTEYQTVTGIKAGIQGAAAGGLILGLFVLLNYTALSHFQGEIFQYEVPMLYIAGKISPGSKYAYLLVLWMGILTTALANSYGFAQRITRLIGVEYKTCLIMTLLMALPLATRDFSQLVNKIYPLFGLLGVLILLALLYKAIIESFRELYFKWLQFTRTQRR